MTKIPSGATSYGPGTKAKAVVARLLEVTGKGEGRNGKSADYNTVRRAAQFGNENGFLSAGHFFVLGRLYNRVMKEIGSRSTSWRNLGH